MPLYANGVRHTPPPLERAKGRGSGRSLWCVASGGGVWMQFHIPGCKPEPVARLAAAKIHLTYAGLYPSELDNTGTKDLGKD